MRWLFIAGWIVFLAGALLNTDAVMWIGIAGIAIPMLDTVFG